MKIERDNCCHNKCAADLPAGTVFEWCTYVYVKTLPVGPFNVFNVTNNSWSYISDTSIVRVYPNAKLVLEP